MIQLEKWETIISHGDLTIQNLHWENKFEAIELKVQIKNIKTDIIYSVICEYISGFRILDEEGLSEVWTHPDYSLEKMGHTIKIKDNLWSKESPLSFFHASNDGWSYLITTDNECLEIISEKIPIIKNISSLSNVKTH